MGTNAGGGVLGGVGLTTGRGIIGEIGCMGIATLLSGSGVKITCPL